MNVWWLAIDTDYSSYEELKNRKVVAQGWPKIGDLSLLATLAKSGGKHKEPFLAAVNSLNEIAYGEEGHTSGVMWSLLSMKKGDLVVGIEGTTVKGLCQLQIDAADSYDLMLPEHFNYAQTVCQGVTWHDWDTAKIGKAPVTPSKGIQGVKGLVKESSLVQKAWASLA